MPNIFSLFPSTLATYDVKENLSNLDLVKTVEFNTKNGDGSMYSYVTKDLKLLDTTFPEIKKIIMNYFNEFKNSVLKYTTTDFEITTSWATKTEPQGFCQNHAHRNSFYSGVLYWQDIDNTSNLSFTNPINYGFYIDSPYPNDFNALTYTLEYKKNLLVFFPSYLEHRILTNNSSKIRYSLAFNFFPIGSLGRGDSQINVLLKHDNREK